MNGNSTKKKQQQLVIMKNDINSINDRKRAGADGKSLETKNPLLLNKKETKMEELRRSKEREKGKNAEEAIKEKKMNAAQTIQKMYRSRRFLRKWWKSVQLLQAKETKRFLHLGWFIMLILVIVSEAVIIVSNGIEDFLHSHRDFS